MIPSTPQWVWTLPSRRYLGSRYLCTRMSGSGTERMPLTRMLGRVSDIGRVGRYGSADDWTLDSECEFIALSPALEPVMDEETTACSSWVVS